MYIHSDILQISILGHIFILYIYNSPYLFYDYVDTGVIYIKNQYLLVPFFFVNAISHNFTLGIIRTLRSWFIIFLVIVSFAVKAFSRSVFDLQAWCGGLGQYLPLANSPI